MRPSPQRLLPGRNGAIPVQLSEKEYLSKPRRFWIGDNERYHRRRHSHHVETVAAGDEGEGDAAYLYGCRRRDGAGVAALDQQSALE